MTGRSALERFLLLLTLVCVSLTLVCVSSVSAQDRWLSQTYGRGVHSFHRGNYAQARQLLDQAIEQGLQDPRAYYFRGLSKLKNGDRSGAEGDIRLGATIEVAGAGTFDIGQALERVQGQDRIHFEHVRAEAALMAQRERARLHEADALPAVPSARPERDYLRTPPAPERMGVATPPQPDGPDASDPFLNEQPLDEQLDPRTPAEGGPAAAPQPSPFEDESPALEAPPATEPAADDTDPFRDDPATDIFGEEGLDTGPVEDSSVEDDIFGTPPPSTDAPPAEIDELDDIFSGDPDDIFGDQ